jgi:hypothetical protein
MKSSEQTYYSGQDRICNHSLCIKMLTLLLLMLPLFSEAQNYGDTKITVTVADSAELYKKVKIVLVNFDFIVKDNYNYDTLTTYPREFSNLNGQCRITAVIKNNTVILSGVYGMKKMDEWGYTLSPRDVQNIIYFKGSKSWALLKIIAEKLGNKPIFSN